MFSITPSETIFMGGNKSSSCLLGRSTRIDPLFVIPEAIKFIGVSIQIPARKHLKRRNFDRATRGFFLAIGEDDGL